MQQSYRRIIGAGLGLAAISYDSPAVLKNFAQRKNIEFPLLSDTDSKIIRSFDILNAQPQKGSATYGIPYPGIYVLNADGVVTAKYFEDDYKERDTAALVLMKQFGLRAEPTATVTAKHAQISTGISDREASMGRHLTLRLDVKLQDHVHVYAPGVQGYIPVDWSIDASDAIKPGPAKYPDSRILRLEAIKESVPVYQGEFWLERDVVIGIDRAVTPLLDSHGDLTITGVFRYQACDDERCYLPESIPVRWTVHYHPLDRTRVPEDMQRK